MSESSLFKHRRSWLNQLEHPHPSKRQRAVRDSRPKTLSGYWDNVSKVWLVKGALEELDRRNHHSCPSLRPALLKARQPIVRSVTKAIKIFARNGGPDLSDLRNYPDPNHSSYRAMSSRRSGNQSRGVGSATQSTPPITETPKTKRTGPYNRQFEQILTDNHVYPPGYQHPDRRVLPKPDNWNDIQERLAYPRPSLSLSEFGDDDFDDFVQAQADASKEKQVCEKVIPVIEGRTLDGRCRLGGVPFGNLADLTDRPLTHANPDVYYGARPEQLHYGVRDAIGHHIVPSTEESLPLVPNFFLETKGLDGSMAVAKRQACYNGAVAARGMHALQTYGQETPTYDNNAYTISSTYYDGTLKMYASHVGAPRATGGYQSEIYMTPLNAYAMTGNVGNFRSGAAAYRNARDYAKEQRDTAILQANGQWHRMHETPADGAVANPALSFVTAEESGES